MATLSHRQAAVVIQNFCREKFLGECGPGHCDRCGGGGWAWGAGEPVARRFPEMRGKSICLWCYDDMYDFGLAPYPRVPSSEDHLMGECYGCDRYSGNLLKTRHNLYCYACYKEREGWAPTCCVCNKHTETPASHVVYDGDTPTCVKCWFKKHESAFDPGLYKEGEEPDGWHKALVAVANLKKLLKEDA